MKSLLSFLLLLTTPVLAFAGPFDPPPGDQSVNLLGVIFGSNIGSIPLGGVANPILSDLMEKFNFIMVVVGLVVVSYVSILSIINTANEGTAMGKKWSAVWVPMRSIAGMALMVPAPESGYSMIQVTVMWIIMQGIGAADSLWSIALDGLASGSSVAGGNTVSGELYAPGQELAKNLLNAQTCMQTMHKIASNPENVNANNGQGNWVSQNGQNVRNFDEIDSDAAIINPPSGGYCKPNSKYPNVKYAEMTGTSYFGIDNPQDPKGKSICGAITVVGSACTTDFKNSTSEPNDNDLIQAAQSVYYNKMNAISSMLTSLQGLSEGFASGDYIQPIGNEKVTNKQPPTGYINQAATAYQNLLSGAIVLNPGGIQGTQGLNKQLSDSIKLGLSNGWIAAGSYYFIFNQSLTSNIFQSITEQRISDKGGSNSPTIPTCPNPGGQVNDCAIKFPASSTAASNLSAAGVSSADDMKTFAKNLGMATQYISTDTGTGTPIFSAPGAASGAAGQALGAVSSFNTTAMDNMANMLGSKTGDPLLNMAVFGKSLMLGVEASFLSVVSIALLTAMGALFPSTFSFMGTSLGIPNFGQYASIGALIVLGIYALLLPVFAMMWSFGAMLAVYCPLIPFMIFTMAAAGWMLTVVEAIIAAPIVALGIILPSGDDIGKIEPALNILANVFLRPMLMIFGFLLAGRVFKAVVLLINFGMGSVFGSIDVSTMFSTLAVIAVYTTFIISIANNCFSLIYAIPDKILRWIGGHGESTDVSAASSAKEATQRAGSEIGGGMSGAGGLAANKGAGYAMKDANKNAAFKAVADRMGINKKGAGGADIGGEANPPANAQNANNQPGQPQGGQPQGGQPQGDQPQGGQPQGGQPQGGQPQGDQPQGGQQQGGQPQGGQPQGGQPQGGQPQGDQPQGGQQPGGAGGNNGGG